MGKRNWIIPTIIIVLLISLWIFRWDTVLKSAEIPDWKIAGKGNSRASNPNSVAYKIRLVNEVIYKNKVNANEYQVHIQKGKELFEKEKNKNSNSLSDDEKQVMTDYMISENMMSSDDSKESVKYKNLKIANDDYWNAIYQKPELEKQFEHELEKEELVYREKVLKETLEVVGGAMVVWLFIICLLRVKSRYNSL